MPSQRFRMMGRDGADAFTGRQTHPDVAGHFLGQTRPVDAVGQFIGEGAEPFAPITQNVQFGAAMLARPQVLSEPPSVSKPKVAAGKQRQFDLTRVIHDFLLSRYRLNLIRAFAMCERTVALEQFNCRATSSAGSPSTSLRISAVRSRSVSKESPRSRYSRCSLRKTDCSGLADGSDSGSKSVSISQKLTLPWRRRKSIAVLLAMRDSQ